MVYKNITDLRRKIVELQYWNYRYRSPDPPQTTLEGQIRYAEIVANALDQRILQRPTDREKITAFPDDYRTV